MIVSRIAFHLCRATDADALTRRVMHMNFSDLDADEQRAIQDAWAGVRTLNAQRSELKRMFPAKSSQMDRDFNKALCEVALELHTKLEMSDEPTIR